MSYAPTKRSFSTARINVPLCGWNKNVKKVTCMILNFNARNSVSICSSLCMKPLAVGCISETMANRIYSIYPCLVQFVKKPLQTYYYTSDLDFAIIILCSIPFELFPTTIRRVVNLMLLSFGTDLWSFPQFYIPSSNWISSWFVNTHDIWLLRVQVAIFNIISWVWDDELLLVTYWWFSPQPLTTSIHLIHSASCGQLNVW